MNRQITVFEDFTAARKGNFPTGAIGLRLHASSLVGKVMLATGTERYVLTHRSPYVGPCEDLTLEPHEQYQDGPITLARLALEVHFGDMPDFGTERLANAYYTQLGTIQQSANNILSVSCQGANFAGVGWLTSAEVATLQIVGVQVTAQQNTVPVQNLTHSKILVSQPIDQNDNTIMGVSELALNGVFDNLLIAVLCPLPGVPGPTDISISLR